MRVSCNTIDEFLICLENEQSIFQNTIRVSINRNPVDGTKRDAAKFDVGILATAVVNTGEGEYLLEVGENCGRDYEDASQEKTGSVQASSLKMKIVEFADKRGWKVLPGIISE